MTRFLLLLAGSACLCAWAGEYAVLTNGFRLRADTHTVEGASLRLKRATGDMLIPAAEVVRFEQEEYTPPAPPVPHSAPILRASSPEQLTPQQIVARAAEKAGLPPEFVQSIAVAESGYRVNAVSPKGAIGLMQLMPQTAAALNADPHDPAQNADAGARYLRQLLIQYQNDEHQVTKAIAAYNAGPGAVAKYRGVPPYRETRSYVARVVNRYEKAAKRRQQRQNTAD